ncbi:putative Ubiquitin carboxyl-terminal hydrolase 33 [Hypsibius exemplaris]|uniref:Ubiquitin carboxyl-terminal hydrolase n=1 Tax=Hypsibius exemplaris TaxID=2072580 RepID=A0A1W0X3G8_HYPEX|nr:putative Ubiquitin carboxyl-terminal hydrolase 33 [Hypsibius exemplaris]
MVPKLQDLLKCIQNQFANATERQRAVVDCLNLEDANKSSDETLHNQIEAILLENGVPTGLFNIGNTCFANAAIQALLACTPFTGYFVDQFDKLHATAAHRQDNIASIQGDVTSNHPNRKLPPYVAAEFSQVVSTLLMLRSQDDSFSPSRLMNLIRRIFPQFVLGHQHDAQEFITCLLDRLHEELQYPVLQLVDIAEAGVAGRREDFSSASDEADDVMATSSTKSDYESCMSLISEDSLYSLSGGAGDDTLVEENLDGTSGRGDLDKTRSSVTNGHAMNGSVDCDSTEDSGAGTVANGFVDTYIDYSPSGDEALTIGEHHHSRFHSRTSSATSHDLLHPKARSHQNHHAINHPLARRSRIVTWRSIVRDLFYGDFAVSVECRGCGEISTRYEGFGMLEVSIPTAEQLADFVDDGTSSISGDRKSSGGGLLRWPKWMSLKAPNSKRRVDLMSCLKHELQPEYMTGDNRYHCDGCGEATDAVKNIRISRLPEVLIIHLKRFKYESSGTSFLSNFSNPDRKIHDLIDFPCDDLLDPTTFNVDFTTKYELRSVISHAGSTLSSGHYTSYVKIGHHSDTPTASNPPPQWYICNDADVNPVSSSTIADSEVYMLFYVKFDPEKAEKIAALNLRLSSLDSETFPPQAVASPRCRQLFPHAIFGDFSDPAGPLVGKEWWSELKWSQAVHRLSAQDFLCPHRLFLPGTLSRLPEVCVPLRQEVFDRVMELFDGMPACRYLHRVECALCAQALNLRPGRAPPSETNGS